MTTTFVEVIGEDKAALHIREIAHRAANLKPAMAKLKTLLIKGNAEQFASHGAFFGTPWPELAPATVSRKGSSDPLVASGKLRSALMGGAGRKTRITSSSVTVGTSLWYAHFADSGSEHEPQRNLSGTNPAQLVEAHELLERYVVHGLV